eukprot:342587-Chlamydomonas_euryale.AAC.5
MASAGAMGSSSACAGRKEKCGREVWDREGTASVGKLMEAGQVIMRTCGDEAVLQNGVDGVDECARCGWHGWCGWSVGWDREARQR